LSLDAHYSASAIGNQNTDRWILTAIKIATLAETERETGTWGGGEEEKRKQKVDTSSKRVRQKFEWEVVPAGKR